MIYILANGADPLSHVMPHEILRVANAAPGSSSPFTNQMLMATIAAGLMLWGFPKMFSKSEIAPPSGVKNFFESILEFLRIEVFKPSLKENTDRFLPYLWTLFFFILTCNLLGFIPIAEILYVISFGKLEHLGGTATGTFSTTAALAIFTFFFIHGSGICQVFKSLRDGSYGHHDHGNDGTHASMRGEAAGEAPGDFGALTDPSKHYRDGDPNYGKKDHTIHAHHDEKGHHDEQGHHEEHAHPMEAGTAAMWAFPLYLWNFAPHPFKPAKGASFFAWIPDLLIWGLLLVLELIGAIIKPFSLSIRLFANMIAGHIVLGVLAGLIVAMPTILGQIGIAAPVTLLSLLVRMLELFVSFLQAYIFTFLTTLFLASSVAPEH